MKILRITAEGLPLFKEDLDICFYAQQRVSEDDKNNLYNMIENYYLHEYSRAAEPPVQCGVSHLSRRTEPHCL